MQALNVSLVNKTASLLAALSEMKMTMPALPLANLADHADLQAGCLLVNALSARADRKIANQPGAYPSRRW